MARLDISMGEEWMICDEVGFKEREILAITIQAAGYILCNRNCGWCDVVHKHKYVIFNPFANVGLASCNVQYANIKLVKYDDVMRKLRNIIENKSNNTIWT